MSVTAGTATEATRRVRPWIATLLSLLAFGLGHFYARRTGRALAWIGAALVFAAMFVAALHVGEDAAWAVLVFVPILLYLAAAVDAFVATNARRRVPRAGATRLLGYVLVFALGTAVWTAYRLLPLRMFYIPSESMVPTLLVGDRMLTRMRGPLCPRLAIERGDVVVKSMPDAGGFVVTRVVALAGDQVRIDARGLEVNGARITAPVERTIERVNGRGRQIRHDVAQERFEGTVAWTVYALSAAEWGEPYEGRVPEGHVFTLGDNRAASYDDRHSGPTPLEDVVGKPLRVTFTLGEGYFWQWRDLRVRDAPSCATS